MTAQRDNNRIPVIQGTLNSDGSTATSVKIDPSTHKVKVSNGASGSDNGNGSVDDNSVPLMYAVSDVDGTTPVAIYVDSSGNLLIDSN